MKKDMSVQKKLMKGGFVEKVVYDFGEKKKDIRQNTICINRLCVVGNFNPGRGRDGRLRNQQRKFEVKKCKF